MSVKRMMDTSIDITDEKIQDNTIPATSSIYGKVSLSLYRMTYSDPPRTIFMPIIPPTTEWVVETDISYFEERKKSQKDRDQHTHASIHELCRNVFEALGFGNTFVNGFCHVRTH